MPKIGLFFGSSTGNCENVARMVANCFHPAEVDLHDIRHDKISLLAYYKYLIFGVPSWNKHYMQDDWHYFIPLVNGIDFTRKKVALYGLGDQINYPLNFVDTMGQVYGWLMEEKAELVGQWPVSGYQFKRSKAIVNGKFVGLALDEDTQYELTLPRIKTWVENLKKEFEINNV